LIDILIIGSGAAGLSAALKAKSLNKNVVVLSKTYPTQPQNAAGQRIDPPVSDPSVISQKSAAIAAPHPELLPPGTLSKSSGFLVGPKYEVSPELPQANSSIFNFPTIIQPSENRRFTTVAV